MMKVLKIIVGSDKHVEKLENDGSHENVENNENFENDKKWRKG